MKILVLGGTSFLGPAIVRALTSRGHEVTGFTRSGGPKIIQGDRNNPDDLAKANREGPWDVVIDNLSWDGKSVALTLAAFPKIKRYILTSTISVYRYARRYFVQPYTEDCVDFENIPADEDLKDVHWKYARGKLEAERALRTNAKIAWTIFRPTIVHGPFDNLARGFWYLARMQDGGPILVGDGGMNTFRLAYAPALGELYALAIESSKAENKTFNIGQEEIVSLSDYLHASADVLGIKPKLIFMPMTWMEHFAGPLGMTRNWILSPELAKKELGFQHPAWTEFVANSARWFRDEWKGDRSKLLETRIQELEIARKFGEIDKKWMKR
jgi:nucleoside-diphosphate-sugar epimerase